MNIIEIKTGKRFNPLLDTPTLKGGHKPLIRNKVKFNKRQISFIEEKFDSLEITKLFELFELNYKTGISYQSFALKLNRMGFRKYKSPKVVY